MNSGPVLDSASSSVVAMVPAEAKLAAPAEGGAEFGDVLDEASAKTEDDSAVQEKEKKEPKAESVLAVPFAFFYPPPEIKSLPEMEVEPSFEGVVESEMESGEMAPDKPAPARGGDVLAEASDVAETVQPKGEKSEGGKIPVEAFKTVVSESVEPIPSQTPKGVETPSKAEEEAPRGTVVAKQEHAMKNGQKSAEIAPTIEQKMPVREQARRVLPEQARFETAGLIADTFARGKHDFGIEAPSREFSVRSLETVQLVETIRTEVTQLRQRGDATVTVILKPDSGTELKLEVSVARDGTIHANARFERGDFQALNAQWPQLQQSLAAQGIRVNDLANPNSSHGHDNSSPGNNFDRGSNSQHREQQPGANFEEELAASTPRFATDQSSKTAAAPTRRWQSWA